MPSYYVNRGGSQPRHILAAMLGMGRKRGVDTPVTGIVLVKPLMLTEQLTKMFDRVVHHNAN
jgi:hypothetical protein